MSSENNTAGPQEFVDALILPNQTSASAQLFFHMPRTHFSRFGFSCRREIL